MAKLRVVKRCLVGIAVWLAGAVWAAETFDFGCHFHLGDHDSGWEAEVAPEPVDVAFARAAAYAFDQIDRDHPSWQNEPRKKPADVLPTGVSTWVPYRGATATSTASIRRRPDGYWSRQRGTNLWVYDLQMYVSDITTTVCRSQGGCTTHVDAERNVDWALCGTGQRMPFRIELLEQQAHVRPDGPPAWLRLRLTHGGLPVSGSTWLDDTLSRHRAFGDFECLPERCVANHWTYGSYTDADGSFMLRFKPKAFKPGKIPVSIGCQDCENRLETTLYMQPEIVVGFFNGVASTRAVAQKGMDRLEAEFGAQHKDLPVKYDWFYNQTACGSGSAGKLTCLEDLAEVFEQRSHELGGVFVNRWETFWDILAGRHLQTSSITGRLVNLLGSGSNALLQWLDATANAAINQLTASTLQLLTLFTDSSTHANQADHLQRLTRHADEGALLLLVAHSQGNLFVNSAHDALRAARPDAAVQVVHVAPASPTLRGEHVLASIDLVINGLRLSGINSVPAANITLPPSTRDATGHGFEPTYLDTLRAAYSRTRGLITQSLDILATEATGSNP